MRKYARLVCKYVKSEPESWPKRVEKVKALVITYIKAGKDNEYILRKFPTFKKGALAAIRAHVGGLIDDRILQHMRRGNTVGAPSTRFAT